MKNLLIIIVLVGFIAGLILVGIPLYNDYSYNQLIKEADQQFRNSEYENARHKYLKSLTIKPGNPEIYERIAHGYALSKNFPESIKYYNKAVELSPNSARIYFNLGRVYEDSGNINDAIKMYLKTLELDQNHPTARRYLGRIYFENNKQEEAVRILKESAGRDPEASDQMNYVKLSEYLIKTGKSDEALPYLEKLMKKDKPDKRAFPLILGVYGSKGNKEKLNGVMEKYLSAYSEDISTYAIVAGYNEKIGNTVRAEEILKAGRDKFSDNIDAYFMLSEFYRRQKKYVDASEVLEQALSLEPNTSRVYIALGLNNYEAGNYAKAEEELGRAISIEPNSTDALNLMAWMYLTSPPGSPFNKPEEALKLAKKAHSYSPESFAITDTLARAYLSNGKYEEAAEKFKENIRRNQIPEMSNYGLAVCHARMGDLKTAAQYLDKALKANFNDKKVLMQDQEVKLIRDDPRLKKILESAK